MSRPVGCPSASRSSPASPATPAASIAADPARARCPSARKTARGTPPATASSAAQRREFRPCPSALVEPLQPDHPLRSRAPSPGDLEERLRRRRVLHVAVVQRRPGRREMHVRVDEPRHDRGARQIDHAVGTRCLAAAHPLDVAPVREQPFTRLRVRLGTDGSGTVKGPHGAASSHAEPSWVRSRRVMGGPRSMEGDPGVPGSPRARTGSPTCPRGPRGPADRAPTRRHRRLSTRPAGTPPRR